MSDLAKHSRVGDLTHCLQCAICTGSCPSSRVIEGYNPRELVLRYLLYGEENEVVDSEMIWCCTTCHTCEERCPHGISVGELLLEIMNHAAQRGNLPEAIRATIASITETGRAIQTTPRVDRMRSELGLEPLNTCNTDEIRELLRECGVDKIMDKK